MQLFVRGSQIHTVQNTWSETVADVKNFTLGKEGYELDKQKIFMGGKPLQDDMSLSGFKNLSTLDVDLRMRGGKVNGSLARARKVKRQAPKVDTQEKSETGRANRRMQYNRIFGVVASTFGRKS